MNVTHQRFAGRSTLYFCLLVALCEGIDLQAAGVAAAGIVAAYHPTPNQLGTFFSASTFGLFFGALIGGRLADSIGRKGVLIASVGSFGIFSIVTAFGFSIESLTIARLLTGLGLGGALPMILALVAENADDGKGGSVAMVYAGTPFGGAVISLVSLLVPADQWRVMFLFGGILPLLLVPFLLKGLQESTAFTRTRSSVHSLPASERQSGRFTAIFAEGRAPGTVLLWISFFLGLLLLYLLLNWLPSLLVSSGLTKGEAAGAQIGFNIGGVLAALLMGYLLNGRARNAVVIATFIAMPSLVYLLAKAPSDVTVVTLVVFFLGCAVIAGQAFLYAMAPLVYPTIIRGVGVGATVAVGRLGSIVGPKLGGALKAAGHGPQQLLIDLVPLVLVGSVFALILAWTMAAKDVSRGPSSSGGDHFT